MPTLKLALIYLWALPTTSVGLLLIAPTLLSGGGVARIDGVLEVHGGFAAWLLRRAFVHGGARAMTLGHVVLGLDRPTLAQTRRHERVHVRQVERWGPLFLPAYLLASLWAALHGRHYYRDNAFEQEAFQLTEPGDP